MGCNSPKARDTIGETSSSRSLKENPIAYVLTHATVLDGTADMEPRPNTTVVVNDEGRIVAVGAAEEIVPPANAQEIDLKGAYLAPGLVNLHVHLCGSGKPTSAGAAGDLIDKVVGNPIGMWYLRRIIKKHAQQQLASGVTTVRSVGDPGFADVDVRDAINAGKYQGPRLLTSGIGVTVPNGHGAGLFAHIAKTPKQAREIVRDCFARKCDLVKLFITGGVFDAEKEGEPGVLRMSPEIAAAAVDEAHKLGMATAAHIESAEGVRVGLEAGVDTIEHGADLTPELIALFKENGVSRKSSLTCTVSPALPFVELDPEKTHSTEIQKVNGNIVYKGIVHAAQAALEAGIPVGLGTDSACPYVTHYDMWREVVYFERIVGAPRKLALHTATLGNARILGLGDETGSIEVGKAADLIVLDENPLENLEALRQVKMVMARGKLVSGLSVKHLPELDRELDAFLPR
ncbi:amidohydrolase family protein [Ellagibacter isourolithinifaciens]|uniref:amidohydrolase family protein n=1 Tax=Ellagibacter isourolithinifaciens TaxID=2137581 RepID=UPI003F8A271E